uniref:OBG-type G domain-containing protein n=1 Tax=Aureoumbra lagunensis TaxID=44058 RepID=A0A6S8DYZ3_9STRA
MLLIKQKNGLSWTSGDLSVSLASVAQETDIVVGFSSGASMALALAGAGRVKRAAIIASPPSRPGLEDWGVNAKTISLPILVVVGAKDELIKPNESINTVRAVSSEAQVYQHPKGHCLPVRASDLQAYTRFLSKALEDKSISRTNKIKQIEITTPEIEDEAEALEAIFSEDFLRRSMNIFQVTLTREGKSKSLSLPLFLIAHLPPNYPNEGRPHYTIETRMNGLEFPHAASVALRSAADQAFVCGEPAVYSAVLACNDLLRDQGISEVRESIVEEEGITEQIEQSDDMSQIQAAVTQLELEALWRAARSKLDEEIMHESNSSTNLHKQLKTRGYWKLSVGIVGKPSVGKSTLFNAVTRSTGAKTAAYPFTTIDPNIREALYAMPVECEPIPIEDHLKKQTLAFGRDAHGRRLMPVLLKDVAGLVPGAYRGLGKGNRFLNDLCDTDALLHVVDASGETDENGEQRSADIGSQNLRDEVIWVREELHRWIVGNVAAKFNSVVRLAKHSIELAQERLRSLFGGYHCSPGLIDRALVLAGLDKMAIVSWTAMDLHRLVAFFLEMRFPTVIALNKCDRPGARERVLEFLQDKSRYCPAVPCSASIDALLVRDRTQQKIQYLDAATEIIELETNAPSIKPARNYFTQWKQSAGTLDALSLAVSRARPRYVFVVSDLDTLEGALAKRYHEIGQSKNIGPLADCIPLHPNASVNDVFHALKSLGLGGDFVRAEALDRTLSLRRVVKRHERIDENTCVIRIATNKKSHWQSSYHSSTTT